MDSASASILMVSVLVIWLAEAFFFMQKGGGIPKGGPGYRAMMGLGIILLLAGIIGFVFSGVLSLNLLMGVIFLALGFINRNRPVKPLTRELKRLSTILVSIALLALASAAAAIALF